MARIEGVDLPREKRVEIGLTYIYGIGLKTGGSFEVESVSRRARWVPWGWTSGSPSACLPCDCNWLS